MGVVRPGQAMLSLGTSGVFFAVSDGFRARPEQAVHSFCHALPDTWHLMSVMLNAASCLELATQWGGYAAVRSMLEAAQLVPMDAQRPWFLPYLNGERTPHNDVNATGMFYGLTSSTRREDLAHSVLEGVGLGLLDGIEAVRAAGVDIGSISVIGGGTRSIYWLQMLADIIGKPLQLHDGGEVGPALGAARLARMTVDHGVDIATACPPPPLLQVLEPCVGRHQYYLEQRQPVFRELYARLKGLHLDGFIAPVEGRAA
jgi:xylulokinase